jgi:hypothetical protein
MTHLIPLSPLAFEPGDRMTRDEFLELWEKMPGLKFAELIDGVVYMPSPLSTAHSSLDSDFHFVLRFYAFHTPGCECLPNATWMMLESAPQPDIALRIRPEYGGRTTMSGPYAAGAPELAVEISKTSRSYDLGPKLALYQRAGVPEYAAAIIADQRIEWRVLEQGSYRLLSPPADGIYRSRIFPGLWLDSSAFWRRDTTALIETLQQGLHSEEHAAFVRKLNSSH